MKLPRSFKGSFLIFLLLLGTLTGLIMSDIPSVSAVEILYETFENWNENSWTNTTADTSEISITSDVVYAGSYALNCSLVSGADSTQARIRNSITAAATIYGGGYWNFSNLPPTSSASFIFISFYRQSPDADFGSIGLYRNATDTYWRCEYRTGANLGNINYIYNATPNVVINTWYELKVKFVAHATAGEAIFWVDDAVVGNATGLDNDHQTGVDRLLLGCYDTHGADVDVLVDALKFDTVDIDWSSTPSVSYNRYNSTRAGNVTTFDIECTVDVSSLDKAWVETNNTGTLANSSLVTLSGAEDIAESSLTLNDTYPIVVAHRWHINSSLGDMATTEWHYLTTTSVGAVRLYTDGRYIKKTSDDSVVKIRGVNPRGWNDGDPNGLWMRQNYTGGTNTWNPTAVQHNLNAMQMMGVNTVRIHLCIQYFAENTTGCILRLQELANLMDAMDMYLLITPYDVNETTSGTDHLPWHPWAVNSENIMPDADAYITFWVGFVQNFTGYPNVMFGTFNEPNNNATSWALIFGTRTTTGYFEDMVMQARQYTDAIISIEGGTSMPKDWTDLMIFNQSENIIYESHIYNSDELWSAEQDTLHGEYADEEIISFSTDTNLPQWYGEIASNTGKDNQTWQLTWLENSFIIFDNYSIGWFYWWWDGYGVFPLFDYGQQYDGDEWTCIPFLQTGGRVFLAYNFENPSILSVGNYTQRGYDYPYSNNTVGVTQDWNGTHLNVTIPDGNDAFTLRVVWNVTSDWPINSTLNVKFSNGTVVDAQDNYYDDMGVIQVDYTTASDVWVLFGYEIEEEEEGANPFWEEHWGEAIVVSTGVTVVAIWSVWRRRGRWGRRMLDIWDINPRVMRAKPS